MRKPRVRIIAAALWLAARVFAETRGDSATPEPADSAGGETVPAERSREGGESLSPFLWMELYSEGGNEPAENNNPYGYVEIKTGKRIHTRFPIDVYAKLRTEGDRDRYFWHNRDDFGLGGRLHVLTGRSSLFFMVEGSVGRFIPDPNSAKAFDDAQTGLARHQSKLNDVCWELQQDAFKLGLNVGNSDTIEKHVDSLTALTYRLQSFIDTLRQLSDSLKAIPSAGVTDVRAGVIFYKGWGGDAGDRLFPFRFWGDVYGDLVFLSSLRPIQARNAKDVYVKVDTRYTNLIASFSPKLGLICVDGRPGSVVAYGEAHCLVDYRGDWYNNLSWLAGGMRYKPFETVDLVLLAEYAVGSYWGRQYRDDVNPNKSTFANFRLAVNFWYGIGL